MDCVTKVDYVPHDEVLAYTRSSQLLLLMVNDVPNVMGHIPGKTYEYIGSGRPILAIGPENADFARVINETQTGVVCGFTDKTKMKKQPKRINTAFKRGTKVPPTGIDRFSRKTATGQMAAELDRLVVRDV